MTKLPPHLAHLPLLAQCAPEAPDCLPTLPRKDKVMAYITHGRRLLVCRHPFHPEAGLQVPGGTMRPGEEPVKAVLREVQEETGLTLLSEPRWLAWQWVDASRFGKQELHRRWFFHLVCHQETPSIWRHFERDPSDGSESPIALDWYWAPAPAQVPQLAGLQGGLLPLLWRTLGWPTHH